MTAEARIQRLTEEIIQAGERKRQQEAERKSSRAEVRKERERMLERQAALEAEINALYPIPKRIRKASKE